jgi:hypothetical protein
MALTYEASSWELIEMKYDEFVSKEVAGDEKKFQFVANLSSDM